MADLVIESSRPSDRAGEIHRLFERAGQPEFATVFERVYKPRERDGLRSWVGISAEAVVLHISLALQTFSNGDRSLTGGLLGDLMADESHRDFWGPVRLARRMVADVRAGRTADFLLTSYLPAAEGLFRAAGFKPFHVLRRFVMPLNWPYPLARRMLLLDRVPELTAMPFDHRDVGAALEGMASPPFFRPTPSAVYYSTRMPRIAFPAGSWLLSGNPQCPDAAILVSPSPGGELLVADALWRDPALSLSALFAAGARWAATAGHRRFVLTTTRDSALARAAVRAGFIARPGDYPLMRLALCPNEELPPDESWWFTPFVLTAW